MMAAAKPKRGAPDDGELRYGALFSALTEPRKPREETVPEEAKSVTAKKQRSAPREKSAEKPLPNVETNPADTAPKHRVYRISRKLDAALSVKSRKDGVSKSDILREALSMKIHNRYYRMADAYLDAKRRLENGEEPDAIPALRDGRIIPPPQKRGYRPETEEIVNMCVVTTEREEAALLMYRREKGLTISEVLKELLEEDLAPYAEEAAAYAEKKKKIRI